MRAWPAATDATVTVYAAADAARALPPQAAEAAYRVAQEAVRNAVRHGLARNVRITLTPAVDNHIQLLVADDGGGFDPAAAASSAPNGHFGLQLMTDAARSCGARLAISSTPARGTCLQLTMGTT